MNALQASIGVEEELVQVVWRLRELAQEVPASVVGGCQITCSDEAEWECVHAFQQSFADALLPGLKPNFRAPLRSVNLGGRFERGLVGIADEHFSTPPTRGAPKLMVFKINSHVGVRGTPHGPEYGWTDRYGLLLRCCGTLGALLDGRDLPAARQIEALLLNGDARRLAVLRDRSAVAVEHQSLAAAVLNARLQTGLAVAEIERYRPLTPTLYLVVGCVTINRPGPDTEIVVGEYGIDWTGSTPTVKYQGLGDDPAAYRIHHHLGRVSVEDNCWPPVVRRA